MERSADEGRLPIVDGDLDNLYYADEPEEPPLPRKKVPSADIYEAARAGDIERLKILLEQGANVNVRDAWDSVALYYACLAGHLDAARMLMESGAICSENTFDGDRCHYAALNLKVRKLLKAFEARPPPLDPLPKSLRELFLSSTSNFRYLEGLSAMAGEDAGLDTFSALAPCTPFGDAFAEGFAPDIVFYVEGQPIEAHRVILIARSAFFRRKFEKEWKVKKEVCLSNKKLSYPALFSLIQFFYTDRLDVAVESMEDLSRICKVCGCVGLGKAIEKELLHQKYAEYKHLRDVDDSYKRFILQGSLLPEEERIPSAMRSLFNLCLARSQREFYLKDIVVGSENKENARAFIKEKKTTFSHLHGRDINATGSLEVPEDHADVCFVVGDTMYRSHQVILAARSEYFRIRLSRVNCFKEGKLEIVETSSGTLPALQEQELSTETFERLLEYMYTDQILHLELDQAEELLDAASRCILFPLKRVVADALLPQLETATPVQICHWLRIADLYGVWKLREYCLDSMAANFEVFASIKEFRKMLASLPPPSGESSQRTSAPSAPGGEGRADDKNLLDDLREKWLEAEGAELDKRDASAQQFDKMLEMLVLAADYEDNKTPACFICPQN